MRRTTRALAITAAAGLAVPLWAAPALAATLTETASVGAYYLAANPGVIGEGVSPVGGQKAPDNAKGADGVAQDDLAVSVTVPNSEPDKFSALMWDLVDLTPGATVEKATVVLPFSTKPDSRSSSKDPALLQLCLAGPEGFGDADGEPVADAPSADCEAGAATGVPVEGGNALEFDITAIAQKWTEMNSGLVIRPTDAGKARPFQTVFADKSQARLALSFTGGIEDEIPVDDAELTVTSDSGTSDSFDAGSGGGSFDAGGGSGSVDSSGGASFDAGALGTPSLGGSSAGAGQAPTVADPATTAAPPLRRVSSSGNPMALDAVTVLAVLAGAALLAAVSLALGAPVQAPGAAAPAFRPGGVASALARRGARLG
jgi:hypothetical protein